MRIDEQQRQRRTLDRVEAAANIVCGLLTCAAIGLTVFLLQAGGSAP